MQGFDNVQNTSNQNYWNAAFLNAIQILSFLMQIENIELNLTAEDLDKQTKTILSEMHEHLRKQDRRMERIEDVLFELSARQKGDIK